MTLLPVEFEIRLVDTYQLSKIHRRFTEISRTSGNDLFTVGSVKPFKGFTKLSPYMRMRATHESAARLLLPSCRWEQRLQALPANGLRPRRPSWP